MKQFLKIDGLNVSVIVNQDGTITLAAVDIMSILEKMNNENKQIRGERDQALILAQRAIQAERKAREERDKAMELAQCAIQAEHKAREERNEVLLFMARLAEKAKP
jgi:hypothetical protein